ncbi:MAG: alpha/beta hydrolase [Candidatus Lokiarchaeota archaeon]|nr:alpha/beta hydrolase [Candidatus Lokiarchaeota archaeon]
MTHQFRKNCVIANGINTYYLEQGEGYPIILLHGGLSTARLNWGNIIPKLSKNYRVISPDYRGHGKTDNPSGKFSYRLMADDIAELITVLNLEKPLICGQSDGGQIALELALNYPELIKAIVISGVLIEISELYVKTLNEIGLLNPGVVNFELLEKSFKEFIPVLQGAYSSVYGPDYWKKFLVEISKVWLAPEEFPGKKIRNLVLPVLIVHADHDDIPGEEALKIFRLITNSELAVAPNSDHMLPINNLELYLAMISDFLRRHG